MRMTRWAMIIAMVAGCDSGAPSCKQALAKAFATPAGGGDELEHRLVDLCEQGWAKSVRTCLANATDRPHADACLANLDGDRAPVVRSLFEADAARRQAEVAQAEAQQAVKAAADAEAKVDAAARDLAALDDRIAKAVDAVVSAQNDKDRAAAKAQLEQLQKAKAELAATIEAAKATAARAERAKGVHVSQECLDNPLAKGCS